MIDLTVDFLLNNFVTIDYETKDTFINKKMGAGWVYKINYPEIGGFETLMVGFKSRYSNDIECLVDYSMRRYEISVNSVVVGQNLIYDIGCYLSDRTKSKEEAIAMLRNMHRNGIILVDTIILAKMVDEHMMSYSLSNLTKKYKVTQKDEKSLADACWETGLYASVKDTAERKVRNRPSKDSVLLKIAYQNLDRLPFSIVSEYCVTDVRATCELYKKLMDILINRYDEETLLRLIKMYSTVQYVIMEMRLEGIAINMNSLRENHIELCKMLEVAEDKLSGISGGLKVNVSASASLVQALFACDYNDKDIPKTAAGNYSVTQAWLEDQHSEVTDAILEVRKLKKIIGTFIDGMRTIQDELQMTNDDRGRVHGEFKLWGAKTGRFSSANPNLQQIPKRDPRFYKVCRGMFVAEAGRKFVASDYSSQETRISVHYGYLLGVDGAAEIKRGYEEDPRLDFHQKVADICEISRKDAKAINLGLSYSMGEAKLCHSLGLPTKMAKVRWADEPIEVAGQEGKAIIDRYHMTLPFLRQLTNVARASMKSKGYLKSLLGRHLHPERFIENGKYKTSYFKALNQLIQGSAADQLIKTMVDYYDYVCYNKDCDIRMIGIVHDEVLWTVPETETKESLKIIKGLMENSVKLEVQMIADMEIGDSWYSEE